MSKSINLDSSFNGKKEIKTSEYILKFSYRNESNIYVVDVFDLNRNPVLYNQPVMTSNRFSNFAFTNRFNAGGIANKENIKDWVFSYDSEQ